MKTIHPIGSRISFALLIIAVSGLPACDGDTPGAKTGATRQKKASKPPVVQKQATAAERPDVKPMRVATTGTAETEDTRTTQRASSDKPPRPLSFDDLLDKADELVVAGETEAAIEAYEAAAERDPKSAVPQVEIARILIQRNELADARQAAELAVELSPSWSTAWNTLGRVELVARRLDDAAEAFAQATDKNAANIYAWNNLGLVRIMQRRFDEAAEALEEATRSDNTVAYMFNNLGTAYEQLGRDVEALVAYKRGLALGSSLAGKNFVRLERKQDLQKTAQLPDQLPEPLQTPGSAPEAANAPSS
jgi:tetratricopeptide (TPR) repeat protein